MDILDPKKDAAALATAAQPLVDSTMTDLAAIVLRLDTTLGKLFEGYVITITVAKNPSAQS